MKKRKPQLKVKLVKLVSSGCAIKNNGDLAEKMMEEPSYCKLKYFYRSAGKLNRA